MRITLCLLAVLASALFSGCETTGGASGSSGKYWEFGSVIGTPPSITTIYWGTDADTVRELLGEPIVKKTNPKDPTLEEWIYERRVVFGDSVKSANTWGGHATFYQPKQSLEVAHIKFRDGRVDYITISRAREDLEGELPYQRTLSGN